MPDPRSDLLFGKIALNWRLVSRDLLNRALHYQRTQEPGKPLGEILLDKGVLSREQVNEILAYQQRINSIKATGSMPAGFAPGGGAANSTSTQGSWMSRGGPPAGAAPAPAFSANDSARISAHSATAVHTPPPDGDALIGQTIGGCRISAKIGAGGMGAIYLAHHESLRKDVVVKILPPDSAANPRTVERFFREARAAAKLEHPNIVSVQDVGTTSEGLNFIIMQYIDGQNLEEKISTEGRQAPPDAVKITLQVAQGLRAAHVAGVIHRDIKAENILVTTSGVVKVTDFGLAKDLNSEMKLTADGAMIGTPLYMAPEIGRVKEIDGRVDIYSLGVTFYYLLTGVQPFRGFSALEILSSKAHDQLKPPEVHFPELADAYRRVLGKMLEKDRDARYPDVDTLIRDLEALERGFPIDAGEPSIWPARGADGKPAPRSKNGKKGASGGLSPLLIAGFAGVVLVVLGLIAVLGSMLVCFGRASSRAARPRASPRAGPARGPRASPACAWRLVRSRADSFIGQAVHGGQAEQLPLAGHRLKGPVRLEGSVGSLCALALQKSVVVAGDDELAFSSLAVAEQQIVGGLLALAPARALDLQANRPAVRVERERGRLCKELALLKGVEDREAEEDRKQEQRHDDWNR